MEHEISELRRRLAEAEEREIEARRQLSEERLQSRQTQQQIQETTLPEFIDACHVHLFLGLAIQPNPDSSTKGDPANADNKLRPAKIREWMGFPQEQTAIWADLMSIDFVTQRHFLPLIVLQRYGKMNNGVAQDDWPRNSPISLDFHFRLSQLRNTKSLCRADQFCVNNKGPEEKVPAFIVEYKAPHKLTLAHIKAGLFDMELDQVVRYQEAEKPEDTCRRVVAAVITQAFAYMINGGLEYGYVCTGEAFIFLPVPHDDPSTVYYYLSVPREDVGDTTGWTGNPNDDNKLHLTALGQVLAFTLRALQTPQRGIQWSNSAVNKLDTWEMIYDDLVGEISELDVPSSAFKSPQSRNKYCRLSPVKTLSKSTVASFASCTPLGALSSSESDDSPNGSDSNTPSRRPHDSRFTDFSTLPLSSAATMSREGSSSKGTPVFQASVIRLLDRQLSGYDPRPDLELGCESLPIHGTCGALFKVTLLSHGYTFVGKGAPIEFVEHAQHEECVYSRLRPIQGVHVPVLPGGLPLRQPFSYDGIAEIVHLMLMGYAGRTLAKRHEIEQNWLIRQAEVSLHAIHGLGVLHNDPIPGNMVWNEDSGRVMYIYFERAQFQERRPPLESMSPNQKRSKRPRHGERPLTSALLALSVKLGA
ncbi:hypothetical protein N7471_000408 [Penicillium samsonianum]|uniref:uncharacterized protein n=1 Tax=Penicillium samsonianum TaxID=1882272 RepID=UPI0025478CC5|nr:uncharacterized protein N7471_000408 [Penicillium samsonianum]KAJ6149209.1 hypothetical protein N7471_000408 [Penicillium samsonianum]